MDRFQALLTRDELSALSTLVVFSHKSEIFQRDAGNTTTADDIAAARDRLRPILYRTGTWSHPENFSL